MLVSNIMKLRLRIMFLILELVFCFLTEGNGNDDENEKETEKRIQHERLSEKVLRKPTVSEITSAISDLEIDQKIQGNGNDGENEKEAENRIQHERLSEKVLRKPTVSEITSAISDSEIYQKIQVERLQQFMYIAPYWVTFIETLNAYKTLSSRPIEFSTDDITTLTSKHDDDEFLNKRILTQIKLYRKLQEIHCTNCVFLKAALAQGEDDLEDIVDYVYLMIDMSYRGRFIVSGWLWKLHIQLLELQRNELDTFKLPNDCFPEIKESLRKILTECLKNNYIMIDDYLPSDMSLKMDDRKYRNFFFDNYTLRLEIYVGNLLLDGLWRFEDKFSNNITGLSFGWPNIYPVIKKVVDNLVHQYESREWPKQPFKHIELHEVLLDVIKARWYSHIWIIIFVYQKIGIQAQSRYNRLIEIINEQVCTFLTDDPFFNDVLNLLSELYTPEDEKLDTIIEKLEVEVNRILGSVTEPNSDYGAPTIDLALIRKKTRNYEDHEFLGDLVYRFIIFSLDTSRYLSGTSLSILLFFIRGNQFDDFVFPNE
ncbi:uncharacterized protein LOC126842111 isoform X3 [Adelges cooleyi]|uniref:uncharacterized protein LOC126842111 isoform X3 n=1 Tax=Adelges cooleyi TaxID=133065 RepID=UPI0021803019|nr:uncharacterized protein LOC126842111 isoform X3 [Adelges cooleyi]